MPSIAAKSLVVQISANGKNLRPQSRWDNALLPDTEELDVGESLKRTVDVGQLHPYTLSTNLYKMRFIYRVAGGEVRRSDQRDDGRPTLFDIKRSGLFDIEIKPMPSSEKEALSAYIAVVRAGEHYDVVRLGKTFLEQRPNSLFVDKVCMETARAAFRLKDFATSETLYQQVTNSGKAPNWLKEEAYWRQAFVTHKRGDLAKALNLLSNVKRPWAKEWMKAWKDEAKR